MDKRDFEPEKLEVLVEDKYLYFENGEKKGFIFELFSNSNLISKKFKHFNIEEDLIYDEDEEKWGIVFIDNEMAIDVLRLQLSLYSELNFWEILFQIDEAFSKNKNNMLKFRGDLAEVIFLAIEGGTKYFETEDVDIELDGEFIEIKSYSIKSKEIVIRKSQTEIDSRTYSVALELSNSGKTIFELLKMIKGNEEFKKYILESYSNFEYAQNTKWATNHIKDITTFIRGLNLNKNIVEARIKLPF